MAMTPITELARHLRGAVLPRDAADRTDGQLLEDWVSRRDEAALAALVRRHGPMVWGVCRRTLQNHHDAEDAFQATFLILVRKAASVVPRAMVPNWLYGVARQTAQKARAAAAQRSGRERQVTEMPEPELTAQGLCPDLRPLLDRELGHLPAKYRAVIVLCDLEGKTRRDVARQLSCPEGTVAGWLARARGMLAKRLVRHGITLSVGGVAATLSLNAASACVPTSVVSATINAARLVATGGADAWAVPANVGTLVERVMKAMLISRIKTMTMAAVLLAVGLGGVGVVGHAVFAGGRADAPAATPGGEGGGPLPKAARGAPEPDTLIVREAVLTKVDGEKRTVWTTVGTQSLVLPVAKGAKITDGKKEVGLTDLKDGTKVTVEITVRDNWFVATGISTGELVGGAKPNPLTLRDAVVKKVEGDRRYVTASVGEHTLAFSVAKDAKITDGKKEVELAGVKTGMRVALQLAARENEITIVGISTGEKGK